MTADQDAVWQRTARGAPVTEPKGSIKKWASNELVRDTEEFVSSCVCISKQRS